MIFIVRKVTFIRDSRERVLRGRYPIPAQDGDGFSWNRYPREMQPRKMQPNPCSRRGRFLLEPSPEGDAAEEDAAQPLLKTGTVSPGTVTRGRCSRGRCSPTPAQDGDGFSWNRYQGEMQPREMQLNPCSRRGRFLLEPSPEGDAAEGDATQPRQLG